MVGSKKEAWRPLGRSAEEAMTRCLPRRKSQGVCETDVLTAPPAWQSGAQESRAVRPWVYLLCDFGPVMSPL